MGEPARTGKPLATYDDLLALPLHDKAEIISGSLQTLPSPRGRHSKAQRALGSFIGRPFDDDDGYGGPGGWWIYLDIDVALGDHDIVRPDLVGVRRERLSEPDVRPIPIVPDWICEVLSPSNEAHDRVTKRSLFARHGVPFYWILDPAARVLEALELQNGRWLEIGVYDESQTARIPPFDAIEIPVKQLFYPRAPETKET